MKSEGGCGPPHLFLRQLLNADYLVACVVDGCFHRLNIGTRVRDSGGPLAQIDLNVVDTANAHQCASHARDAVASGHAGNFEYGLAHGKSLQW